MKKTTNTKKREDKISMPKWMDCTWRRVACGKNNCPICGKIKKYRQKPIKRGGVPDSVETVFQEVGQDLKEVMSRIREDAARMGIDIANIDGIKEPPRAGRFVLYKQVKSWRDEVYEMATEAAHCDEIWTFTELVEDLTWYANILPSKIYRQLCNRWHIKQKDGYGDFDYEYTKYVLTECAKILETTFSRLLTLDSPQKPRLIIAYAQLLNFKKKVLNC